MADTLLSLEQACQELQLTGEQVTALVKQGALRGFLDGRTYKFRKSDLEEYKQKTQSSATVIFEDETTSASDLTDSSSGISAAAKAPDSAGKLDLEDIDSVPGIDESDQTSVLAPVDEKEVGQKAEDAVFEFSEEELGLSRDGDGSDSVLVADESDSSLDILDVAEESSEASGSATDFDFTEESGSGEEVVVIPDEAAAEEHPSSGILLTDDAAASGTVTDILGDESSSSDDALDSLDVAEVVGTSETILDEAAPVDTTAVDAGAIAIEEPGEEPGTHTAGTVPVTEEAETVGIEQEAATHAVEEEYGEELPLDLGEEEAEEYEPAGAAAGYDLVTPSALGNTFLILALVLSLLSGLFLFWELIDVSVNNSLSQSFVEATINILP